LDLKQIRDAVSELRAASPKSVLVGLVEEKIRALGDDDPGLQFDYAPSQRRRTGSPHSCSAEAITIGMTTSAVTILLIS
jgi:hypothetical protein